MSRFVKSEQHIDAVSRAMLAHTLSLRELTARALCRRGVSTLVEALTFLEPAVSDLHDPLDLPDMALAVDRIKKAIACHERICIYGDYDADGVCATAILYKQLRRMGADVECFIPSRHEDGYGMHEHTVELLCENGIDLIITVDNGISASEEIALCTEYGVDVIVTDHHIPPENLPDAYAIVAASRRDSSYPCPWLCGAGVALKLATALADGTVDEELLGLAAVATMADVVPLRGENRMIVQLGLPHVRKNAGFSALLDLAGSSGDPDAKSLAFMIAPRLNAAGRMGDASRAIALLTSNDPMEIHRFSNSLQNDNLRRREDENLVLKDIFERFTEEELQRRKVIVLSGAGWNIGVLGIVASRLCERYYRPVILFTEHQGNLTGSGRSTTQIHLHDAILPFADRFVRFGGHARAVGITIAAEKFDAFAEDLTAHIETTVSEPCFEPTYCYEEEISLSEIDSELIDQLSRLEPFGEGNPMPVFRIADAPLQSVRTMGKTGDHLDATVHKNGTSIRLVGFQQGRLAPMLEQAGRCDLLCTLENNTFRNRTTPELRLVACNVQDSPQRSPVSDVRAEKNTDAIFAELLYNDEDCYDRLRVLFSRLISSGTWTCASYALDTMRERYRNLRRLAQQDGALRLASLDESMLASLCVFAELGFFAIDRNTRTARLQPDAPSRPLTESMLYRTLCTEAKG